MAWPAEILAERRAIANAAGVISNIGMDSPYWGLGEKLLHNPELDNIPPPIPDPQRTEAETLLYYMNAIQTNYQGESNIPPKSEYWRLLNRYRSITST